MTQSEPTNPVPMARIQENLVARSERRLLNWLCARMPAWVNPDHLTFLALGAAVAMGAAYFLSNWNPAWLWIAVAGYFIHWFGDSTDGSLARHRGIERPRYGYFLDHSCDGIATLLVVGGIGMSPYVELEIALLAVAGYLLMSIHAFLAAKVLGELKLSYMNAGPTEARIGMIGLTLAMLYFGPGAGSGLVEGYSGYDLFVAFCGAMLVLLFCFQTAATAIRLSREEPARNDEWRNR